MRHDRSVRGTERATGMATIGFIGLGNMGAPMAANLLKAGHAVTGFDMSREARAAFAGKEGRCADNIAGAVRDAAVIVTMLPAGPQVRAAYLDSSGIIANAKPGTLLIDSSTVDVATTHAVARAATEADMIFVDAPVSGGTGGARAGTLTFMVGAAPAALERATPFLAAMGNSIIPCGGPGTGQAAKICNNMVLGITMTGISEAFVLAEKLGITAQTLFDVCSKSSGQCWSLTSYCPAPGPVPASPANRDYQPGFTVSMMLKDLKLAQEAAQSAEIVTPLGAEVASLYQELSNSGMGAKDFSVIIRFLRRDNEARQLPK